MARISTQRLGGLDFGLVTSISAWLGRIMARWLGSRLFLVGSPCQGNAKAKACRNACCQGNAMAAKDATAKAWAAHAKALLPSNMVPRYGWVPRRRKMCLPRWAAKAMPWCQGMPRPRHGLPRPNGARLTAKWLPELEWVPMPRHVLPRQCHSNCQGIAKDGLPRPRHVAKEWLPRHATAKAWACQGICQGNAMVATAKAWAAKAKAFFISEMLNAAKDGLPRNGCPCQGCAAKAMPNATAKAWAAHAKACAAKAMPWLPRPRHGLPMPKCHAKACHGQGMGCPAKIAAKAMPSAKVPRPKWVPRPNCCQGNDAKACHGQMDEMPRQVWWLPRPNMPSRAAKATWLRHATAKAWAAKPRHVWAAKACHGQICQSCQGNAMAAKACHGQGMGCQGQGMCCQAMPWLPITRPRHGLPMPRMCCQGYGIHAKAKAIGSMPRHVLPRQFFENGLVGQGMCCQGYAWCQGMTAKACAAKAMPVPMHGQGMGCPCQGCAAKAMPWLPRLATAKALAAKAKASHLPITWAMPTAAHAKAVLPRKPCQGMPRPNRSKAWPRLMPRI
uniref:Uncharacterized protein n=1 Tax=Fagus sylvatica TaxID=28930 RepID=A0A2N9GF32_FAGSY